jgi:hypothetical protein
MNTAILTKTNHSAIISIMFNFRRMNMLGGILKSLVNPASLMQLAMGPAGWASLAMKTIGSQIAMSVIQQLGQKMGLPQSVIDLAQAAFASASGQPGLVQQNIKEAVQGLVQQMDLRPSEAGQLERELNGAGDKSLDNMNKIVESFMKKLGKGGDEEGGEAGAASGSGSGSVLMRIARAMGQLMDEKMNAMAVKGDQLGKLGNDSSLTKDGSFNAKGQTQYGKLTSEMQALGQELSMLSQAVSNSLKSIGEASTTMARKG